MAPLIVIRVGIALVFGVGAKLEDAVPGVRSVEVGERELPRAGPDVSAGIVVGEEGLAIPALDVSAWIEVGEKELPSPELETTAFAILPEGELVKGTVTSTNLDVRKQTVRFISNFTSILSL